MSSDPSSGKLLSKGALMFTKGPIFFLLQTHLIQLSGSLTWVKVNVLEQGKHWHIQAHVLQRTRELLSHWEWEMEEGSQFSQIQVSFESFSVDIRVHKVPCSQVTNGWVILWRAPAIRYEGYNENLKPEQKWRPCCIAVFLCWEGQGFCVPD